MNKTEASVKINVPLQDIKVLVADPISDDGIKLLEKEVCVNVAHKLSSEELKTQIKDIDGLVVRSETKVTRDIIESADKLRVIARAGVGTDNIDVEAATKKGIVVINSPEGNTISAAEHTMALILALIRKIPQAHKSLVGGEWNRSAFTGQELYKKTIGIVGFGKIGRAVAERAKGFQMQILAYDPFLTSQYVRDSGVEMVSFKELLERSDIVTIHVPLTKETACLIGEKELKDMKKGSFLINCARGGIVDEYALYNTLKISYLGGAALDVFAKEPPLDSPLLSLPNVVFTPHLAASTKEAQVKVAVDVVEQMLAMLLLNKPPRSAVNIPYLSPELAAYFESYLSLMEKMGSFIAQIVRNPIISIELTYQGDIADKDITVLTNAAIKGLLSNESPDSVNFVNASVLARSRGITVSERKNAGSDVFTSLITMEVQTAENGTHGCSGTIFRGGEPRIVRLEGYSVDVPLSGYKLITWQTDTPGVVGRVGTLLGKYDINIAEMQVGREKVRGCAIMVLSIDDKLSAKALDEVRSLDGIDYAVVVVL